MGPAGPTGNTGPTGPANTLLGIQTQLADSGGALIADSSQIIFDTITNDQANDISYNLATGVFTITAPGNYYVSWWVSVDGSDGPIILTFAVKLNGGGGVLGSAPTITGQINGSALVTVAATPATITLVNVTGAAVVLADTPVQANLVITEVGLL
jgi:hypothetical protein